MSDTMEQAMPWPNSEKRKEDATASETTSGTQESTPWIVVAVNLNPAEAVVIKSRLESEDIPAITQQEALGSVLGLTVGPLGSAKVLVPEPLAERALEILAQTFDDVGEDWDDEAWDDEEWADESSD